MDPIVKGILRCTDTVVAAEEPISKSEPNKEKNINFWRAQYFSMGNENTFAAEECSPDIVPDYTIYLLTRCGDSGSDLWLE